MKKVLASFLALWLAVIPAVAGTITKPFTFTGGSQAVAAQVNACFDTIYAEFNGSISSANLAASSVGTTQIQASAVTTAKIADANVTTAKIAVNAADNTIIRQAGGKTLIGNSQAGTANVEDVTPATYHFLVGAHQLTMATGSVTNTVLGNNAVDYTKFQQLTTKTIVGNATSGTANAETVTPATYHFTMQAHQITLATASVTNTTLGSAAVDDTKMSALSFVPVGCILDYGGSSAPTGWLLCDGSAVSRTTYSALFAVVSTTYGVGDGSTTFNLPDLRGRVVAGKDNMGGSTASRITAGGSGITGTTLGAAGGAETHTMTTAELVAHVHSITLTTVGISSGGAAFPYVSGGGSINTNSTGSSTPFTVTQPTLILNKIIKAGV